MRKLNRNFLFLGMLLLGHMAAGQESLPAAEAVLPAWQWRCVGGDALLNFNPSTTVDSSRALVFDSLPYARDYTVVVVYKPVASAEAAVWRLDYDSAAMRGLTTEHILSDNVTIRYTDSTAGIPVINTLRQTAPDSTAPYVRLTLGGDTLAGTVKVSEVLYFDRRLGNAMLRRVQGSLAVRYGITLGPVDYVDGMGGKIWPYADSGLYHHRVTGVGRDSTYRLHQLQSRSEMPDPVLTLGTDSLSEGHFLVCGDNGAPLAFGADGDIEVLDRRWRIYGTGDGGDYFHLAFDTRGFAAPDDSLVLLADGFSFRPDVISPDGVTFRYVVFPSDTGTFTLARGGAFWQTALSSGSGNGNRRGDGGKTVASSVYPNPSTGSYTIEVTGADWVRVSIYNAQGVLMDSYGDSGQGVYLFNGSLPSGNSYYATVATETGTQTMKLIVK